MNKDNIKDILNQQSYMRPEEGEFIYDFLIKLPKTGRMLELGTGLGHSTVFFAKMLPEWVIYTVDAYGSAGVEPLISGLHEGKVDGKQIESVWEYIESHDVTNVTLIVSSFAKLLWELEIDCLFIDGTHWYDSVKSDFDKFSPFVKKDGIVIFDDYNKNWGVKDFIDGDLTGWEIKSTGQTAVIWKKAAKEANG